MTQAVTDIYCGDDKDREGVFKWIATDDFLLVAEMAELEGTHLRHEIYNLFSMPRSLARKYGANLREALKLTR